jgi:hypothetical protein
MTSPNKPKPKTSKLARMMEKPVWRRKSPRNKSIITNEVGNHSTPPTTYFPNLTPNPQGHLFDPLYKPYNIGQTSSFMPNYTSHPPTTYNDPYKYDQPSNYNSNYTNPIHPYQHNDSLHIATEKQKFLDEITQIHDLSDLLAMHRAQRNKGQPPSSPYANCLPHSLNLDQVTNHTHYCPCCIFFQKRILYLSEDISWIEYLLTHPHPIPPLTRYNIVRSTSSAPYSTPYPSPSNN